MPQDTGSLWFVKEEYGFDALPPREWYASYMRALLVCANGDGALTRREREWVVGFCAAHGGSEELQEELRSYPATDDVRDLMGRDGATNDAVRRSLVYHAIRAAYADGDLSVGERAAIQRMAGQLDVPAEVVDQLLSFHEAERRMKARRMELLLPSGRRPY